MATLMNPFETEFLNKHCDGIQFDEQKIREYNLQSQITQKFGKYDSLYCEFTNQLGKKEKAVTVMEFIDFVTRFTFLETKPDGLYELEKPEDGIDSDFFRGKQIKKVGILKDNDIYDENGKLIAINVGSLITIHHQIGTTCRMGSPNEVIVQLPKELRHSDKAYYYTCDVIGFRYCESCYQLHFYREIFC